MVSAMHQNSRILDDLSKLAGGAAGALLDMRREVEGWVAAKVDALLDRRGLVSREEFEAVRDMAAKAREENGKLADRLAQLEQKIP